MESSRSGSDFEYNQFLQELYHEISSLVYAEEEGTTWEDKFTEHIMEILAEAGETEGYRLCSFMNENTQGHTLCKINGYSIEEGFETIDIFITHFKNTQDQYRVSKSEFEKLYKWPTKFVNDAIKGYLDGVEPSAEAFGLAEMIKENKKSIIRVNVFILSNGNIPHDPPKNFQLKSLEELTINFHVWDGERLHRLSQSKNNREPIEIDFRETLSQVIPCLAMPSSNELYECYLAIVPGQVLSTLYKNFGTRLLESNVRAFLQQTGSVNKGIRDTIRNEPFMFLPYNNGLAATAQEVSKEVDGNGQLVLTGVKDFQIVNGGQTTASLFHTEKKYKADLSEVFVQMKLTVIKDEEKKDETVPYISRYANSQNKVSELDLTSNNPLLQSLEALSRVTYAIDPDDPNKQTIWFFERVKGQYREALNREPRGSKHEAFKLRYPRNQVIIKSQIAKYMNIWKQLPHHVSKGGQKNYNFYLKEAEKEFKRNKPTRVYWEDIVANALLFKEADTLFGRKNKNPIGDTNIKSYTVTYALSYIHYKIDNKLDLGKIWSEQRIQEPLAEEIRKTLVWIYGLLTNLDVALVSEAAKAEKTWIHIKEQKDSPLDEQILSEYLISEEDFESRYSKENAESAEVKYYQDLEKITAMGLKFWDGLFKYNSETEILSSYQETSVTMIRNALKKSSRMSDRLVAKGIQVIDIVNQKNIDVNSISELSRVKEEKTIDPAALVNRLNRLSDQDWNRIFDLGSQTGSLNLNEISTLKTVRQKLKRNETVDLKRLKIAASAIDKMKRFGVKY